LSFSPIARESLPLRPALFFELRASRFAISLNFSAQNPKPRWLASATQTPVLQNIRSALCPAEPTAAALPSSGSTPISPSEITHPAFGRRLLFRPSTTTPTPPAASARRSHQVVHLPPLPHLPTLVGILHFAGPYKKSAHTLPSLSHPSIPAFRFLSPSRTSRTP
jgi:hypothetical protein